MSLRYGILGLINYLPKTGYEIYMTFKVSLNFFWQAQKSQVYRELSSLEKDGFLTCEVVNQEKKPDKKVFSITDKGRDEFMEWLMEGLTGDEVVSKSSFLMKIFFSGELTPKQNIATFEKFIEECKEYEEKMMCVSDIIYQQKSYLDNPSKAVYWQITNNLGRSIINVYIEWAQESIRLLSQID